MKKVLNICLMLALCAGVLASVPLLASATTGGTCGENLTWTLDDNGTLTISGTGEMANYDSASDVPWCSSRGLIQTVVIEDGVTSVGECAFAGCDSLINVIIPKSVTEIGSQAFYSCGALANVTIPDGVTKIGGSAFSGCDALASVEIGDGVVTIGSGAFGNCESLTSVTIPDSVISIGNGAFCNCNALMSVTLGNGVTSIGYEAFGDCGSLSGLYYKGTKKQWERIDVKAGNGQLLSAELQFLGDVNLDEVVDISDAVVLFQYSMLPDLYQIECAGDVDFNKDGAVDVYDAVLLFQHSMLPDLYPIG